MKTSEISRMCKWLLLGTACIGLFAGAFAIQKTFISTLPTTGYNYQYHTIWHPVVLGLAIPENEFAKQQGIAWNDPVGETLAKQIDPEATYFGPTYEHALMLFYARLWRLHPDKMKAIYINKLKAAGMGVITGNGYFSTAYPGHNVFRAKLPYLTAIFRVFPDGRFLLGVSVAICLLSTGAILFINRPMSFLLSATALAGTLVFLEHTIIIPAYSITQFSFLLFWFVFASLIICQVPINALSAILHEDALRLARRAVRWPALWVAVAVVCGLGVYTAIIQRRAVEEAFYRTGAKAVVISAPLGSAIASWTFSGGMPIDWAPISAARLEPLANATRVTTNAGRFEYQIANRDLKLPPGRYEAHARGAVEKGDLELGVLDSDADRWAATTHYWHGQDGLAGGVMVTPFSLEKPTRVRIILSNWNARAAASRWTIQGVEVRNVR